MGTMQQVKGLDSWVQDKLNEIMSHCAWHGDLTGVEAEALLRDQAPFTYLLRQGERFDHFYLSFVNENVIFFHLPCTLDRASMQWFYRNWFPHYANDLKGFIPEIMHKEEAECHPLVQFANQRS